MLTTDKANVIIWQLNKLRSIQAEGFDRKNMEDSIRCIMALDNPLFIDALFRIRELLFGSIRAVLVDELKKELYAVDSLISEDLQTFSMLKDEAEKAIYGDS